jgi:hypothetical protein
VEPSNTVGTGDVALGKGVTLTVGLDVSDGDNVVSSVIMVGRLVMVGLSVRNTVGTLVVATVASAVGVNVTVGTLVPVIVGALVVTSVVTVVGMLVVPILGRLVLAGVVVDDSAEASGVGTSVAGGSMADGAGETKPLGNKEKGCCVTPRLGASDGKADVGLAVGSCVVAPVGTSDDGAFDTIVNIVVGAGVVVGVMVADLLPVVEGCELGMLDNGSSVAVFNDDGGCDEDSIVSSDVGL